MAYPKAAIILLDYKNLVDTQESLASLNNTVYPNYDVFLVDNGNYESTVYEKLKQMFPKLKIISPGKNLGFTGGNNIGIKYALENQADYVLLLNNDTEVKPDFLSELIRIADSDARIGIVGPKIYFSGSKTLWFAGGFLNKKTGFTYHRGENESDNGQYDNLGEVDFVSGCAMLIKKEVFEKIGMLDNDYYHSHEDANFCIKAKEAGFKIVYVPKSVVYHKLARSSGGRRSPFYLYYRTRNHLIFKKKLSIKAPLFWPVFCMLVIKRIIGSFLYLQPKGAYATVMGIYDYLTHNWGKGRGDSFR